MGLSARTGLKGGVVADSDLHVMEPPDLWQRYIDPAFAAPDFYRYVAQSAFGMLWSRPGLAIRDRSLVTVAQLAALGRTNELRAHLAGALNVGISREELIEVLMQTAVYAGVPAANDALQVAADVLGVDD